MMYYEPADAEEVHIIIEAINICPGSIESSIRINLNLPEVPTPTLIIITPDRAHPSHHPSIVSISHRALPDHQIQPHIPQLRKPKHSHSYRTGWTII